MQFAADRYRIEAGTPLKTAPSGVSDLSAGTPIAYLPAEAIGVENHKLASVTVDVRVDSAVLPDGAAPADLVVYRYTEGTWEAGETAHLGDGIVEAEFDGISTLAIGVESAAQTEAASDGTAPPDATPAAAERGTATEVAAENSTESEAPGFGVVPGLLALGASILLFRRLRR